MGKEKIIPRKKWRIKSLFIASQHFGDLLLGRVEPLSNQLPKDVIVRTVYYDYNRNGFVVHLESESYPGIEEGSIPDSIGILVRQKK